MVANTFSASLYPRSLMKLEWGATFFKQHIQAVVIQASTVTNSNCCHCRSAALVFRGPKESNTINQSLMSCLVHLRRSPMALFHYLLSSVWMSQNKRLMGLPGVCPPVCLWEQNGLSTPTPPGGLDHVISWQRAGNTLLTSVSLLNHSDNAERFWLLPIAIYDLPNSPPQM